jgi:hypothetical protein
MRQNVHTLKGTCAVLTDKYIYINFTHLGSKIFPLPQENSLKFFPTYFFPSSKATAHLIFIIGSFCLKLYYILSYVQLCPSA